MYSMPVDYRLSFRFDSLSKITEVHVPIAVVYGERDPMIPFELGHRLYSAAAAPKKFFPEHAEIHEGENQ